MIPAGIALTAALLIIGDEILAGKVDDTNSSYLCRELYALGWRVVKVCLATYCADLHQPAQSHGLMSAETHSQM